MLIKKIFYAAATLAVACACTAQQGASMEELQQGWENPPQSARNRVWWHWMNGNITKDGIKKDLQWMKDTRQGGVHNFDAALGTPTIVDKRLIYMDEGWKDAFAYAVQVADSLGLEFTVASAPGWSSTGGPWVSEKDGMKKLVWSETWLSLSLLTPQVPSWMVAQRVVDQVPSLNTTKTLLSLQ